MDEWLCVYAALYRVHVLFCSTVTALAISKAFTVTFETTIPGVVRYYEVNKKMKICSGIFVEMHLNNNFLRSMQSLSSFNLPAILQPRPSHDNLLIELPWQCKASTKIEVVAFKCFCVHFISFHKNNKLLKLNTKMNRNIFFLSKRFFIYFIAFYENLSN